METFDKISPGRTCKIKNEWRICDESQNKENKEDAFIGIITCSKSDPKSGLYHRLCQSEWKEAYSGDDYRIELTENSVWNEGCTVNADVENVSQKQIRNWSVILTLKKGKISNAWNVDSKVNGNNVILSSKEYNMVLAENGETSFGFQMQGANLSDIESAYLVTETASVTKNLSFDYRETSSWQEHKIVEVTLTNTGTKTIKDWSAAFRMNGEIDNIWNAQASVVSWIHRR